MAVTLEQVLAVVQLIEPPGSQEIATLGSDALPYLEQIVREGDPYLAVRAASLATLIPDANAVRVVTKASESEYPEVRLAAAAGLWRLVKFGVVGVFTRLLADPDPGVRRYTLRSIAHRIVVDREPVEPELERGVEYLRLRDRYPGIRSMAYHIARRLKGEPVTLDEVREGLAMDELQSDIADLLGPAALQYLTQLVREENQPIPSRAVTLASILGGPETVNVLMAATDNASPEVRLAAAYGLYRSAEPGTTDVLVKLLTDSEPEVRHIALGSAAKDPKRPEVRKIVEDIAAHDPNSDNRELASQIILRLDDSLT